MKKLIVSAILFICTSSYVLAQNDTIEAYEYEKFSSSGITGSTGINNSVGIFGIGLYKKIHENIIFEIGGGIGSWGYIGSLQLQYYLPRATDLYIRGTFKRSGGGRNIPIELELSDRSITEVSLNLYPTINAQFTVGRSWDISHKHRFFIEGGYSYFVGEHEDKYKVLGDKKLTENSKKQWHLLYPVELFFH
ncbi:MAG: hypothetical protein R6U95_04455 [Bacteroidales bacterium]